VKKAISKKAPGKKAKVVKAKAKAKGKKQKGQEEPVPQAEQAEQAEAAEPKASSESEDEGSEEETVKGPKTKANRFKEAQEPANPREPRGILYIGHIPLAFQEPEMTRFFEQFGKVTRLRLSRSKKNGNPRGYGWVEFEEECVARVVAETMHKYLLFGRTLVCHLVPPEKTHGGIFKGARKKQDRSQLRRDEARKRYNNRPLIEVGGEKIPQPTLAQESRRQNGKGKLKHLLKSLEIDYDVEEVLGPGPDSSVSMKKAKAEKLEKALTAAALLAAASKEEAKEAAKLAPKAKVAKVAKVAVEAEAAKAEAAKAEAPGASVGSKAGSKKRRKAA